MITSQGVGVVVTDMLSLRTDILSCGQAGTFLFVYPPLPSCSGFPQTLQNVENEHGHDIECGKMTTNNFVGWIINHGEAVMGEKLHGNSGLFLSFLVFNLRFS